MTDRRATDGFGRRLLTWYEAAHRDLPWRRTRDPWAIWVSEIMLQQTRVEAVREPYARFLDRYPTPAAFAEATDDEVMVAWRGLGYYRRARMLRDGARKVVAEHAGDVPSTIEHLRELPGIGPYTLGAIASIAFGHPEPAVDGNVERVVSRHRGLREPIGTGPARRAIHAVVAAWMPSDRPGDFSQAMMELGATICTPQSPSCEGCPVREDCIALQTDCTGELPIKKAPRKAVEVTARVIRVAREGHVLGYRIPAGQANAGQIELPGPGILVDCDPDDLAATVGKRFGADLRPGAPAVSVRHAITHHRITLHAHPGTVRTRGKLEWFALTADVPWTTPSRKVFARMGSLEA